MVTEEVYIRLVDHYIDIEIARLIAEGDVADWKAAEWAAFKKKARNATLGIGATTGTLGPIAYSSGQYEKGIAADRAANKASADVKAQSAAAKTGELIDYIKELRVAITMKSEEKYWGDDDRRHAGNFRGYAATAVLPPQSIR